MRVIGDHLLLEGTGAAEARDARLPDRPEERQQQRAVTALERLDYRVTLERTVEGPGAASVRPPAPLAASS
jgi:hypothetical protein